MIISDNDDNVMDERYVLQDSVDISAVTVNQYGLIYFDLNKEKKGIKTQ